MVSGEKILLPTMFALLFLFSCENPVNSQDDTSADDLDPVNIHIENAIPSSTSVTISGLEHLTTLNSRVLVRASVTPAGDYTYWWFVNGTRIDGATSKTLSIGDHLGLGSHRVAVLVETSHQWLMQEVDVMVVE